MPGWHEATVALQNTGRLQMVGIIQEQHPDRARLFMQWKQMDWPILVDSLNLAGIDVVPISYALDEHGIVRYVNPQPEDMQAFLETEYHDDATRAPVAPGFSLAAPDRPDAHARAAAWREYGDGLFLWGGDGRLTDTIGAYERAIVRDPADAAAHFRLGVTLRRRYETAHAGAHDFQRAAVHWMRAIELEPNQYIWRRRLQQYGPRLGKPYPFYDWVEEARRDVLARGDTPVPLGVEPGGAEIATPAKVFEPWEGELTEPDPEGRIFRDPGRFIIVESAVAPPIVRPGEPARVHLRFRPNAAIKAHWNNEVEATRLWVMPPAGWTIDSQDLHAPQPADPVSAEIRDIQFEVRSPAGAGAADRVTIPAYALYYVCEDVDGTCLYRRQDLAVSIEVRP